MEELKNYLCDDVIGVIENYCNWIFPVDNFELNRELHANFLWSCPERGHMGNVGFDIDESVSEVEVSKIFRAFHIIRNVKFLAFRDYYGEVPAIATFIEEF
jgi:hypothetical protein